MIQGQNLAMKRTNEVLLNFVINHITEDVSNTERN